MKRFLAVVLAALIASPATAARYAGGDTAFLKTRVGGINLAAHHRIDASSAASCECVWGISLVGLGVAAASTEYPLLDALNSVMAITDASGQVVREYQYDVYGARVSSTGTGPDIDRGFTGRYHDASGAIDNRHRMYLPREGRFLQPDRLNYAYEKSGGRRAEPLGALARLAGYGDRGGYLFAENAPTMRTDPSGLWALWGLTGFPGFNVEWWSHGTSEHEDLQRIYYDVVVGMHWDVAFPTQTFSGGCESHAHGMAAAINKLGITTFTPKVAFISPIPDPLPKVAVHAIVILVPIPPSKVGRVFADTYLWPAMGDWEPDDDKYIQVQE